MGLALLLHYQVTGLKMVLLDLWNVVFRVTVVALLTCIAKYGWLIIPTWHFQIAMINVLMDGYV